MIVAARNTGSQVRSSFQNQTGLQSAHQESQGALQSATKGEHPMDYTVHKGLTITNRLESLDSETTGAANGERPRKRVRRGTRSCWECKRRKIRCQLSSDDVPVCSGCLSRGTTCLSQEYPEERDASGRSQVGERLGRVEELLETLVAKISAYDDEDNTHKIHTPESMRNDVLSPFASVGVSAVQESAPSISLFDQRIGHRENNSQVTTPAGAKSTGGGTTSLRPSCRPPKLERLRVALVDLLPSQEDTNLICEASSCWLLIHALSSHAATVFAESQNSILSSIFNLEEVMKRHPTIIARTILYISVCLQQLHPNFEASRLHLYPSMDVRIEEYMSTVQALVTSDDELVSTMEGLECLTLQGIYYINAGSPRRAWLVFRRALNVGQLMGIHRGVSSSSIPGGRELWYQLVQADRYLALLLGLPAGSSNDRFGPEDTFQNQEIDKDRLFTRRLCEISTRIIDRNQAEQLHAYATTQQIDEQLDNLSNEMPQSWWAIPESTADDHSEEAAIQFHRLMTQIWFYQLEAVLHLPFMLLAGSERRYDYSKFSCLKASRELMWRYLALRSTDGKFFCCKVIDFSALTATVTLFLGLLGLAQVNETQDMQQQRVNDRALVHTVLRSMEELSNNGKHVVATQSVNVIRSLLEFDSPTAECGNLHLTIPYFGTISIVRPTQSPQDTCPSVPMLQPQQSIAYGHNSTTQAWQGAQYRLQNQIHVPIISFTSSQFQPLVPEVPLGDLVWQEPDTLFFDSLLNTDIDGNWIF